MKRILVIILLVSFVAGFLLLMAFLKKESPNRDDAKLSQIYGEVDKVPIFPGFVKVGEQSSSRFMDAGVYQYFRSPADYESVKMFYESNLGMLGWDLAEADSRKLVFRKADLTLQIDYRPESSDWNYGLSYVWRK
jgi:hypothetical protein